MSYERYHRRLRHRVRRNPREDYPYRAFLITSAIEGMTGVLESLRYDLMETADLELLASALRPSWDLIEKFEMQI